jgi:hypothetical protein
MRSSVLFGFLLLLCTVVFLLVVGWLVVFLPCCFFNSDSPWVW